MSSKSPKLKISFLRKTNKHLVFDVKKEFKKPRASVNRKAKSIRVNKKKPSSENSNAEQNKSTNITLDDSSNDSSTIIEDTTLEKHEADKRHSDMSLIEESLGFSAFRHYAVQTQLKQSVDQVDFKKKTLNDWNIMSLNSYLLIKRH